MYFTLKIDCQIFSCYKIVLRSGKQFCVYIHVIRNKRCIQHITKDCWNCRLGADNRNVPTLGGGNRVTSHSYVRGLPIPQTERDPLWQARGGAHSEGGRFLACRCRDWNVGTQLDYWLTESPGLRAEGVHEGMDVVYCGDR